MRYQIGETVYMHGVECEVVEVNDDGGIRVVRSDNENWKSPWLHPSEVSKGTFYQYITRVKRGKWMFGAIRGRFILLWHVLVSVWAVGVAEESPYWIIPPLAAVALVWAATYLNFRKRWR